MSSFKYIEKKYSYNAVKIDWILIKLGLINAYSSLLKPKIRPFAKVAINDSIERNEHH